MELTGAMFTAAVFWGYAMQLIRAVKPLPSWLVYPVIGGAGALLFWLAGGCHLTTRECWWTALTWMFAARGVAATAKDAKAAPATNSLGGKT